MRDPTGGVAGSGDAALIFHAEFDSSFGLFAISGCLPPGIA
jgi:hypothetical protein